MKTMNRPRLIVHTNPAAVAAQRKRDLALIHMGKAALGWSDEDYRYHLMQRTGKTSAADLGESERRAVLAHMQACGFNPRPPFKRFGQTDKIEWLWRKLGATGALHNTNRQALLAFVQRVTGRQVHALRFLSTAEASTVIEALKAWLDRAKKEAAPNA